VKPRTARDLRAALLGLLAALAAPSVSAQLGDSFGQNKIVYETFRWKVYPSPHFDIYYDASAEPFLQDVVSYAESAYLKISKTLDHEPRFRIPLVIYKTHAEFEQTNIVLSEIPEAVGAFAEPIQNRMVLPIDQPPDKLYALIAHELTHIFQYDLLFEGYLSRVLRSNPPLWLMEGLASYLAEDEDNMDRMVIRDAVVNNVLPPIERLDVLSFLTYRYGHAIFDFIEQEYGTGGLRNFLFEYRKVLLANNVEKAIKEAFGIDTGEFNRRFNRYLRRKYFPVLLEKKAPEDYGKEVGIKREGVFTFSPTLSPSGELIAALASPKLELDLVVLSAEDGKQIRNLTRGWTNRYEHLVAEAFAGKRDLSWSPAGDRIAVFARKGNRSPLLLYDALEGGLERKIELPGIVQAASPAFSPDGQKIAFEGNRDGVVDLFELDLRTGSIRNLTQDDAYDANPWYAPDGKTLLYNRRIGPYWKIFSVSVSDPADKMQLTFGPSSDIQPSFSRDGRRIYFASDRGPYGVFNIHSLELATGEILQYTDVVGGCFSPAEMAPREGEPYLVFTSFFEGTFRLYRMPLRQPEARLEPSEAASPPVEAVPFEPALKLTPDTGKIRPYRPRWNLEVPSVSVGVTDDGTFLSNVAVQFTDLLGDYRIQILASSVSDFSNAQISYVNLKRRLQWGASLFDFRDFFLRPSGGFFDRDQVQRTTGVTLFAQYPLNRYYRVEAFAGALDRSQDFLARDSTGFFFERIGDRFGLLGISLTGDTTRFQSFGPFHGKRFRLGATYGINLGTDAGALVDESQLEGNLLEYQWDFRAYRQLTRRSLLAWRLAGVYNAGARQSFYGFGGINQLRGWDFREFFGSNLAWSNLEFRFPLVDELRFPFGAIRQIRGFLFLDVGAAWLQDDLWYDPELAGGQIREQPITGEPIPFKAWDSANDRLQDARGSYGYGFQFRFIGGLQFNWVWSHRLPYTRYVPDPAGSGQLVPVKADTGGTRTDFYVVFDF
jgi:Tol biopolymer transport system component